MNSRSGETSRTDPLDALRTLLDTLRAQRRTGGAIRELLDLAPPTARVVRNGEEIEVPLAEVHRGDVIRIRRGLASFRAGRKFVRLHGRCPTF